MTDVVVTCASSFAVGGVVVGLGGATGLVLTDNGTDDLPVGANGGPFVFSRKLPSGGPFDVAIKTQPSQGGPCQVSGGKGTIGVSDVTSVVVNCAPGTYAVGGTVTGLSGTVVLRNNGGNDLVLSNDGSFAFSTTLAPGAPYSVSVLTQPGYPPKSQTCTVANASGTMGSANVSNVNVTCTTNSFTVSGNVTGLTGTLVLKNNGGDALTRTADGPFTFTTAIQSGNPYAVTVGTQPSGQSCTVMSGSGTVGGANVTGVAVACAAIGAQTVYCANAGKCTLPGQICCHDEVGTIATGASCVTAGSACPATQVDLTCDDPGDCGGLPNVCCAKIGLAGQFSVSCVSGAASCTPQGSGSVELLCDPLAATPCPSGGQCVASSKLTGYYKCQ